MAQLLSTIDIGVSVVFFHRGLCFRSAMAKKLPNNALSQRKHDEAIDFHLGHGDALVGREDVAWLTRDWLLRVSSFLHTQQSWLPSSSKCRSPWCLGVGTS